MALSRLVILLLSLSLLGRCIQFQPPAVAKVVGEMIREFDDYVHFNGSKIEERDSDPALALELRQSIPYWYEQITKRGVAPWGPAGYQVYRNVKDYGARGDGVTDDTAAINAAIAAGGRCGRGCASSSTTPAVVYFPSGTYLLSSSILDFYFTQLIGDPNSLPVLKGMANFQGFGLIDANPYYTENLNWGSTNVFLRQIRNFVFDLRGIPSSSTATGIHWPTSQATSLQNIVFQMSSAPGTQHTGLFCESGSAGFMSDLTFNGGLYGAQIGNQQFTMRNLVFNNCVTAISQFWDWGWVYQGISINNCGRGIDISAGGTTGQTVGSMIIIDSSFTNTPVAIVTSYTPTGQPDTAGSLILENVRITNVPVVVQSVSTTLLAGTTGVMTIAGWGQGHKYSPTGPTEFQGPITPIPRLAVLAPGGVYYAKSKPQYNNLPVSSFTSARSGGATGNGVTDDTVALQNIINTATAAGNILFLDAGTYRITSTLSIPPGARLVGEGYSVIMSSGSYFNNAASPAVVVRVGNAGQTGRVEWSDIIIGTQGPQSGAILIQWNLASPLNNPSGMWDVHARIGGTTGSNLQFAQCAKAPGSTVVRQQCVGAYMTMHITRSAQGLYMENNWLWTADHDFDDVNNANSQIDVYNGRGLLVESTNGGIWLVGTGVEHHTLYQYQFSSTKNIFAGFIQTETPYYQPNPQAPIPFTPSSVLKDPTFDTSCAGQSGNCKSAWGLRIINSQDISIYGAGLYSFFDNWSTTCSNNPGPENCQNNIFSLEGVNPGVTIYTLSTIGTINMATVNGNSVAKYFDNLNVFTQCIAWFKSTL